LANERYSLWAEGIGKSWGREQVLKSASVWAAPGKVTTLLGRNGSGKTTLLRVAVGQLRPDHGVVSFLGTVTERPTLARMARRGLMYLPQEQLVMPTYRVRDHVHAVATTFGIDGIGLIMRESRIEGLLDQRVATLSRGERVRLSMALALLRRPTVLVADEPLVGLSPKDQESTGKALRRLAAEGTAVVTSGHDTRVLLSISDVIIWSVAGTTHSIGSPAEALRHAQFRREYLGPRVDGSSAL
jgi:lipopolysaccharide export system ATP-binding protein